MTISIIPPPNLLKFLISETEGYRIITVGSSAGAYAAILYGCQLGADKIFAFNPQFELNSLLETSTEEINPLLFRLQDTDMREYYDIVPVIKRYPNNNIFYFLSERSQWDKQQYYHLVASGASDSLNIIGFNNKLHGIPFPRAALNKVLNLSTEDLKKQRGSSINPIIFSIRQVGLIKTVIGLANQIKNLIINRLKR